MGLGGSLGAVASGWRGTSRSGTLTSRGGQPGSRPISKGALPGLEEWRQTTGSGFALSVQSPGPVNSIDAIISSGIGSPSFALGQAAAQGARTPGRGAACAS